MRLSPRSLLGRLTATFAAIAAAAILLGAWLLNRELVGTVHSIHEVTLQAMAEPLTERLRADGVRALAGLAPAQPGPAAQLAGLRSSFRYVVLTPAGEVLVASVHAQPGLPRHDLLGREEASFDVQDGGGLHLWGLSRTVQTPDGPLVLQVAQDMTSVFAVLDDVPRAVFWPLVSLLVAGAALLFLANLGIALLLLRPLRRAAAEAAAIRPGEARRIGERGIPTEVRPLIRAVNAALDRLDEAFARQRRFSQDVAHELRTPLAILTTEVDLLEDRAVAERLRRDLDGLARLVAQLLEAAEAAPRLPDRLFDLAQVCATTAQALAPAAAAAGRSITLGGEPGPVWVRGDPDALGRAVRNLLENALTHTPPGTAVELRLRASPPTVEVADRGPGIPEAQRALVFARFWRADRGRRGGAGIGLSIVSEIAALHGGAVEIRDNEGGGAVFALTLPAAPARTPQRDKRSLTGSERPM
ncbi:sensor histidine kinase [Caldovatus aquaticus]|uniref:histidine kinase n=1 Tax=Caldovatus aquaticus TaxID=2865671 RepID=A0ABS7F172_9PROT|nr:HAMP domain-containing sensor histidine kinase [Caldovatus aquaticus]MBW8268551.1 HAMP domain-containing histidine kinase [Caldovatus aquaticus]